MCVCVSYPHTTEAVVSAISLLVCPILKPQQPPFQRCRPVGVLSPNDNSHSLSDVVCACPILKPQQPPSLGYCLCVENGTKTHLSSIACMCCMRIKPTTSTTVQATGSRLPNYGRDPRKLRARPCQTTGAGWPPAPQCIIFGISCTPDDCGFRSTYQTKKYTQTVNLIVLKGSHCNLPRHPNSILSSKCHPTASLSTMTWQAGRTKIMGLRIEKKP